MTMSAPRRAFCHQFSVPNREIPRVLFSSWLRMPQTSKILYQYDLSRQHLWSHCHRQLWPRGSSACESVAEREGICIHNLERARLQRRHCLSCPTQSDVTITSVPIGPGSCHLVEVRAPSKARGPIPPV